MGLAVVAVIGLAGAAWAQAGEAPGKAPVLGDGKGQVTLTWDEFVKVTGYDPTKKSNQVLTIPWKQVEDLLGVELKSKPAGMDSTMVDMPWTEFKALLEWSVKKKPDTETPPPTDFIVTSCQYDGVLTADAAAFTLKLKLNVLRKEGWKRIPVLPGSVAMTESTLPEGVFLNNANNMYELLTDKTGALDVALKFSVSVNKNSGIYSVGFDRLLPSSTLLDLIPSETEKVEVKVAGAQSQTTIEADKSPDKKIHVLAAIPAAQGVSISWERKIEAVAVATKLYAETRTLAAVAEGILVCQESIDINILHTAVKELKLAVPTGVSVLEVVGRNIVDWRADKGVLTVNLRGDAIGAYNLNISYEAPIAGESAEVPVVRVTGVEREKGFVGVIALANVEIDAGKVDGASVIDVRQLPGDIAAMTKAPILLGFRYVGEKFSIALTIKKHDEVRVLRTIVDSGMFTVMQLDDGRRMTRAVYTVRNNRSQFLRLKMPEGASIWSAAVGGNTVSPATDDKKNVLIPLVRSAAGAQELASFPVEVVYVETPEKAPPAAGKLHVVLPGVLDDPTMHVMVDYYLPADGKYEKPGGLFTAAQSGFSGTLGLVSAFATMSTDPVGGVTKVDAAKAAAAMQVQFEAKVETEAKAAGATPIKVRLPIEGKLFKFEKILALSGDDLTIDVEYTGWKPAK
jgi:limonene-1,2-epoxide hydrolase